MKTLDEPLAARALRALGEQCQIPLDVEERILASLPMGLFEESSPAESDVAAGPESGVFRSAGEAEMGLALSALEAQCEIPFDVEERILDRLLAPPTPVIPVAAAPTLHVAISPVVQMASVPHAQLASAPVVQVASAPVVVPIPSPSVARYEPLKALIHRSKQDASRERRIGAGAAFGALLVAALLMLMGSPSTRVPTPLDVNATQVSEGDPLLREVGAVLTGLLVDVAHDCHLDVGSAVVWFERSGHVSMLDVPFGHVEGAPACLDRVAAAHRLGPHDHAILVQLTVRRDAGGRGSVTDNQGTSPAAAAWPNVRVTVWRVDET